MAQLRYRRVLLKLSGEALSGGAGHGLSHETLKRYADEIAELVREGVQLAIVVGGGNILRGAQTPQLDRAVADRMGMLATIINCLAMSSYLSDAGIRSSVMSVVHVTGVTEPYDVLRARTLLDDGVVVLLAGGTGNPFVTTDTAAVIRASELRVEALLKATKVDGVYDSDPELNPSAKRFNEITLSEALRMNLKFMDSVAMQIALERRLPILVFSVLRKDNLLRLLKGEPVGTVVKPE